MSIIETSVSPSSCIRKGLLGYNLSKYFFSFSLSKTPNLIVKACMIFSKTKSLFPTTDALLTRSPLTKRKKTSKINAINYTNC